MLIPAAEKGEARNWHEHFDHTIRLDVRPDCVIVSFQRSEVYSHRRFAGLEVQLLLLLLMLLVQE